MTMTIPKRSLKKEVDTEGIKDDRDFRPSQKEIEDNMSIKEKAIKAIFG